MPDENGIRPDTEDRKEALRLLLGVRDFALRTYPSAEPEGRTSITDSPFVRVETELSTLRCETCAGRGGFRHFIAQDETEILVCDQCGGSGFQTAYPRKIQSPIPSVEDARAASSFVRGNPGRVSFNKVTGWNTLELYISYKINLAIHAGARSVSILQGDLPRECSGWTARGLRDHVPQILSPGYEIEPSDQGVTIRW